MKLEQWGTFSVKDHLKPRAFVAEVLLFDKLVIPRPATANELYADSQAVPLREDQRDRWFRHGWNPDRQRELLDILGEFDLAVELPWNSQVEQDWQTVYNQTSPEPSDVDRSDLRQSIQDQIDLAKFQTPEDAAYLASGGLLALYVANQMSNRVARKLLTLAKTPGVPVEPVIAYGSYSEFAKDQDVREAEGEIPASTPIPYAMFGWEFFVPEDSDKSDAELLRQAAKLASRPDFCETRQYFQGWLKQMYEGEVDRQDAYEQMLEMLSEYTKISRGAGLKTAVRYAAKAAAVLAPLAGLAGHTLGVELGVAVSGASLGLDWLLPTSQLSSPQVCILVRWREESSAY
jgi:hypothetical protein